jgi:hypothetical protein
VVVVAAKEPFPLSFQVEAGVYLNAIRSSLDILACTLANRHCQALIDDTYFPVAPSETVFFSGKGYKGDKFVKALPPKEQEIIESLKPYRGQNGNQLLCALHGLDIVRKHQRLLSAEVNPRTFVVSGWGRAVDAFTPVSAGWVRTGIDETTIGLLSKSAIRQPTMKLTPQVSLRETDYLPRREVITALNDFAKLAKEIIRKFDY